MLSRLGFEGIMKLYWYVSVNATTLLSDLRDSVGREVSFDVMIPCPIVSMQQISYPRTFVMLSEALSLGQSSP